MDLNLGFFQGLSANLAAVHNKAANFANSEGCNEKRPIGIQRRAPFTYTPTKYIAANNTAVTYIIRLNSVGFCNFR